MVFDWLQSIAYAVISGFAEVLPISAQVHRLLLLKMFGMGAEPRMLRLFVHVGVLLALYYACQSNIIRMIRARKLARIPKKKRKRPLDTRSLMEFSLWRTMVVPVIVLFFLYDKASALGDNKILMATFLFLNGLILYIPQFLPTGNKDCRTLSRVEGILMGLGGSCAVIPGFSGVGASLSIASVCGVDRTYGLGMVLLMDMGIVFCRIVWDFIYLFKMGLDPMGFLVFVSYIVSAGLAFAAAMLGIKLMRRLAAGKGYGIFAYYCWGLALFTFVLNLVV